MDHCMTRLFRPEITVKEFQTLVSGDVNEVLLQNDGSGSRRCLSCAIGATRRYGSLVVGRSSRVPTSSALPGEGSPWHRPSADVRAILPALSVPARRSMESHFALAPTHSRSSSNTDRLMKRSPLSTWSSADLVAGHSSSVSQILGSRRNRRPTSVGEGPPK